MILPLQNLDSYKIILASQSPRRKELLEAMGLSFQVRVINNIDESYPSGMDVRLVAEYIATQKAEAYCQNLAENELIITADTVVICNNNVMGKPLNRNEAIDMLNMLSGKAHLVITGVSASTKNSTRSFSATTKVCFDTLTQNEIAYYVDHFKPYDKAGAYGIQEWIGHIAIHNIEGSYFNVMGLPVQKLYKVLKEF